MRAIALLLCLLTPTLAAAASAVAWQDTPFEAALARAAAEQRPLFVDVYAEWCGPCHALDAKVFSRADVGAALADMVTLKVDAESASGKPVAERYHVVGYPTLLVIGPDGQEIDRIFGYVEGEELIRTVADYRAGKGTLADLEKQLAATPPGTLPDATLVARIFERSAVRGLKARAEALLPQVLAADPANTGGRASSALFSAGRYLYLRGAKDYPRAILTLEDLRKRFPASEQAAPALMEIANAQAKQGDDEAARASLEAFIATAPDKSRTYNRVAWFSFKEGFDLPFGAAAAERGLKVDPKDAGLWDTLAEIRAKQGNLKGAVAAIDAAIAADPAEAYYGKQKAKFSAARK